MKFYKSKTELLLVFIMSFNFKRKAKVRYNPNPKPTVTKDIYMKNKRTFVARIPNLSAKREATKNPCFSKKCNRFWTIFKYFFQKYDYFLRIKCPIAHSKHFL